MVNEFDRYNIRVRKAILTSTNVSQWENTLYDCLLTLLREIIFVSDK